VNAQRGNRSSSLNPQSLPTIFNEVEAEAFRPAGAL
jgi:hypothetical protein